MGTLHGRNRHRFHAENPDLQMYAFIRGIPPPYPAVTSRGNACYYRRSKVMCFLGTLRDAWHSDLCDKSTHSLSPITWRQFRGGDTKGLFEQTEPLWDPPFLPPFSGINQPYKAMCKVDTSHNEFHGRKPKQDSTIYDTVKRSEVRRRYFDDVPAR